jgi:hypothetical protein
MPYYSVIEGEGVAGPLNAVSAETTTLLSCIGIVFHNIAHNVAGLDHYGANTIHQPLTQNTILQMINDLQPDDVYLISYRTTSRRALGSSWIDIGRQEQP